MERLRNVSNNVEKTQIPFGGAEIDLQVEKEIKIRKM
jgi:hypothetical protein